MKLCDLTKSCKTTSAPVCSDVRLRRKAPATNITWTLTLVWDIDTERINAVIWPEWVSDSDRTKILRAVQKDGKAVKLEENPLAEVDCDIAVLIGGDQMLLINGAHGRVKRQTVTASEDHCQLRVLLLVETTRAQAPELCDLLDADVVVTIRATGQLFDTDTDTDGDGVNLPKDPPVPRNDGLTPEQSLAPRKRGKGKTTPTPTGKAESLPPEA